MYFEWNINETYLYFFQILVASQISSEIFQIFVPLRLSIEKSIF